MLMEDSLLFVTLITIIITKFDNFCYGKKMQFGSEDLLQNFTSVIHVNACTARFIQILSATLISNVSLLYIYFIYNFRLIYRINSSLVKYQE